ncbi:hypothetical protein FB566_2553 [Stackebrandtia endophytica]|uniref:Uncharacterized protein n=1 Tax=Stackebrandtia endophytica TaxID=1496996 RepID=A0A543AWS7_9ACTN|nr:hypothetical protein [Stackebrandtia endophytica]TQL77009.1 hypothetical protein FB566_2553 [Stackebrandtia endophytica]
MTENDSTSSGQHYELDPRSLPSQTPPTPPPAVHRQPAPASWAPVRAPAYQPPIPPPAEPPGPRPSTVTAAGISILGTVILALIGGTMLLIPENAANQNDNTFMGISGGLHLVIALGFIGVSLGVFQGRNGGRITAFVLYGFAMLFNGCLGSLLLLATKPDDPMPWQGITFTVIMLLLMFADVVVIILLALTPSNRWFRAMSRARKLEALRHRSARSGGIR